MGSSFTAGRSTAVPATLAVRYDTKAMTLDNKGLVLDFIEWVAKRPRPYAEVMDAWRTSCPRLMIWEDALDHGFVTSACGNGSGEIVSVTAAGRAFLLAERRAEALG
jgi:hypothetical protein